MRNPLAAVLDLHRQRPRRAASAYAGAEMSRLTTDWALAVIRSADQELKGDLRALRKRSRELCRNNPFGNRFLELLGDNVIGHDGIRFQATNRLAGGKLDTTANMRIEEAWNTWSEVGICTADGRSHLVDVETLAVQAWAQDGEALVRLLPGFDNEFGFAVQFLDADQLDETFNRSPDARRNEIRMGVEIDRWGRPVTYHVWNRHPQDFQGVFRERIPIPADQIIHLYRPLRVGQTRGVPRLAPVMIALHMLYGYEEAELIAARIASAKGGFFTRDAEAMLDPDSEERPVAMDVEPGLYEALPPGWKFQEIDPKHPTSAFPDFRKGALQSVAAGAGTSYAGLSTDLEGTSFSSGRTGTIAERDAYRRVQWFAVRHLMAPIQRAWLKWSLTTGAIDLSSRNPARWRSHRWQPRGWDWVDPEADIRAAAMAIRLGIDSRTRIAAQRGLDLAEVLRDLAEEERLAAALGVEISTDISRSGGAAAPAQRTTDARADQLESFVDQPRELRAPSYGNGRPAPALTGNGRP